MGIVNTKKIDCWNIILLNYRFNVFMKSRNLLILNYFLSMWTHDKI